MASHDIAEGCFEKIRQIDSEKTTIDPETSTELTPSSWVGWLAARKRVLLFAADIWSQVAISIRLLDVDLAEVLAKMREGKERKGNGCSVLGLCVGLQRGLILGTTIVRCYSS
ncbi:hypothetical protein CORC01_08144 [Colletotrichum orchidophilum]|uniref:Uncharacterized protein n=1 Tax=Colletotrichum orchidophilum TaxID=1209926 RepID=A0A1G4B5D6_9PEZI|nr:uncharacterized protein CORC01_08144 [Colletotrichum orchidophilum]OHE96546.1 hypothetical protein CORC01_08144 [Colletotrichum orchidophilum]